MLVQRHADLPGQAILLAQHRHLRLIHPAGHQPAHPPHVAGDLPVPGPPQVVRPHVRRTLLPPAVPQGVEERVGVQQVRPPDEQPVHVPLHVIHGEGPLDPIRPAAAEALIGVALPPGMARRVRGALGQHAVRPRNALPRPHKPPHHVLPRQLEGPQKPHVPAFRRMPGQRHAVGFTPVRQLTIVGPVQPSVHRPAVAAADALRLRPRVQPQGGQVGHIATLGQEVRQESRRPGQAVLLRVAPGDVRLVGEHGDNGLAEMLPQRAPVDLVGQADEGPHRVRVQQVGGGRGVGLAVVLVLMHAADGAAGISLPEAQKRPSVLWRGVHALRRKDGFRVGHPALRHPGGANGHHVRPGGDGLRRDLHPQAPGGEGGVLPHHHAVGGAGGIHGFVVKHDAHVQPGGLLHGEAHEAQVFFGHVGDASGQALAGVDDEPRHALIVKITDLPGQLRLGQLIVPEPEGNGRIVIAGLQKGLPRLLHAHGDSSLNGYAVDAA